MPKVLNNFSTLNGFQKINLNQDTVGRLMPTLTPPRPINALLTYSSATLARTDAKLCIIGQN